MKQKYTVEIADVDVVDNIKVYLGFFGGSDGKGSALTENNIFSSVSS